MARLLRMPEVAANTVEAVLAEWPIAENTPFRSTDAIATVETEKAVVDVPADTDGVILKMLVPAGAAVEVGAPIALLGDPGEQVEDLDALLAELGAGSATVTSAPAAAPVTSAPAAAPGASGVRIFSSPLARRLAKEAGLSIADLAGTGPGGRIVRRDVEKAANESHVVVSEPRLGQLGLTPRSSSATATTAAAPEPILQAGTGAASGQLPRYQDTPHTRMRRAIAARLTQSTRDTPHFALHGTARVDKLLKLRARLNGFGAKSEAISISVNDLVVSAAARAHLLVPGMNVIWTPEAVRSFSTVDIALAVATEGGLLTPVLRGVDQMTLSAVAAANRDLVDRGRSGHLRQDELEGAALTITNLGMYGTEDFEAIINPPQSAILAVGAALKKPVVAKGRLKVGTVMSFTLSVDHRPIDGATAAQWMAQFISLLQEPVRILA
jgi:pyruvate dehydrogenase E2 component (dihydrolipoamide acetyltransferase)